MRGIAAAARRHAHLPSSYAAAFSSFSGIGGSGSGGAGRGRGRGLPPSASAPPRAPGSPITDDDNGADLFAASSSAGRGRGEPLIPPSPAVPSFSGAGRGRGSPLPPPPPPPFDEDAPKQPTFAKRFDSVPPRSDPEPPATVASPSSSEPPRSTPTSGAGRGVPREQQPVDRAPQENRFIRRREEKKAQAQAPSAPSGQPKLAQQEAVKRALELLGRGDTGGGRGRGGRGSRGRGRDGPGRPAAVNEQEKVFLGDNADGEKLEQRLGPDKMKIWDEAFDEAANEALPHLEDDARIEAIDTNSMIEFEPEYNLSFGNPDIEEKPPMSLEEVLQKIKPFVVAYEGIQNQEEWEEAVEDVMKRAPEMKLLIDMYSGPDVVTAKQQEGELERVANTLPETIPNSVKRFTDKTLLSLKNNPGWGFDKKCQFMDKFVREVSEQYK